MKIPATLSICAWLSLGLGAALAKETVLAPVGPEPPGYFHGPLFGSLKVFTPTEEVEDGDNFKVYPHTAYRVCAPNGRVVRFVDNHRGIRDEDPEQIDLPPGRYIVHADSDRDGFVAVPVIVKAGRTTVVDLEAHRSGGPLDVAANRADVSPGGQVVGWKADASR